MIGGDTLCSTATSVHVLSEPESCLLDKYVDTLKEFDFGSWCLTSRQHRKKKSSMKMVKTTTLESKFQNAMQLAIERSFAKLE